MSSQPDPTNLPPGTSIHGWRVVKKLGQGGYGVLYLVELGGYFFALKMAQHRADSGDTAHTDARIRRELSCLSLVHHPHIVRVWSHGYWPHPQEGFLFLVEDYVEGYTLAEWAEHTHPTFRQVVALLEPVADALETAHQIGIFHRDLKPSNILVRQRDHGPVITDFSVGDHPLAEELTEGPVPPGTRRYRSPEALKFERQHLHQPEARYRFQATDELFALGATLYDLLTDPLPTGRHPRLPLNNDTLPPPSPIKVNPRVPPALSDLIMALLDPNPRARPPSAGALHRMVGELKADPDKAWDALVYPPSARRTAPAPPPQARQTLGWLGWPRAAALGAALVALLLGAILFSARGREEEPRPAQAEHTPQEQPLARGVDLPVEPPAPQQPPLGSTSPPSQKENNAVSLSRSTPETPSAVTPARKPQKVPPSVRPKPTLKQCAALIGLLEFLKVGCATVQLRPEPGECPEEAVKAMIDAGQLNPHRPFVWVQADANIDDAEEHVVFENGPITSKFGSIEHLGHFPEGTLLDGHLWVSAPGDRVFGRFTRARLPDGTIIPLCLELCSDNGHKLGYPKSGPGPREGTAEMRNSVNACWARHWR
ncbi:MAG: serine/threonine protein kinase [Hyalangium sp.]|uniref:serine/threonine protein kinase n=1 Tax=Hyalangium sp. TaxID=2028555 RepID=UPI003899C0B4